MFPKISSRLPLLPFLANGVLAAPQGPRQFTNQTRGIQWGPCEGFEDVQTMPLECATLPVPLDYLALNSTEKLDLKLAKVAATKQPSRGTIQLNFGGPGAHGREQLAALADQLIAYTGGYFDLVAFDTRATLDTIPFSCHGNESEKLTWDLANRVVAGNSSDTALGELWTITQNYVDTCKNSANATRIGDKIGTTYIARDLISVVDALGEDGLLRYWGLSYGSALGATVAAMFPERVDRVIIDGVVNLHDFWHYHDIEMMEATDRTFSAFLEACIEAGEEKCALARPGKTASQVEEEFYEWVEDLKYHPISYPEIPITYTSIKAFVFGSLYDPHGYAALAGIIDDAMTGSLTDKVAAVLASSAWPSEISSKESRIGIVCSDKTSRESRLEDALPAVREQMAISQLGGDVFAHFVMQCDRWHLAAKERYLGDFDVPMRHPVLAIGNTYDPITAWASAVNASESLPGAVALKQNGFGHASTAQASICTVNAIQAYLVNGTLPEPGTVCEVDEPLFSNVTWKDVLTTDLS